MSQCNIRQWLRALTFVARRLFVAAWKHYDHQCGSELQDGWKSRSVISEMIFLVALERDDWWREDAVSILSPQWGACFSIAWWLGVHRSHAMLCCQWNRFSWLFASLCTRRSRRQMRQKYPKTLKMPHSARILTRFPQPACKLPFIFCVKESVRNFQPCSALKSCKHVEVFGDMCAFRG